jgi:DNA (cytosine-5)-methyltransferase 1
MNALSLFSGIGGLDIAAESAGFKTVAFCERDKYCQSVLKKHWPNTRIFDDVRTIDTAALPRIDVVFGGYPCQPFSQAGRKRAEADERHLWPAMRRVVQELRPTWLVGENVKGHITRGLDGVIDDLEDDGYAWRAFCLPALAVAARHFRERVFIVAHSKCLRDLPKVKRQETDWPHAERPAGRAGGSTWWKAEPGVGRVADGVPSQMDRLKTLGNAVVPELAYQIFAAIAETYNAELCGGTSATDAVLNGKT